MARKKREREPTEADWDAAINAIKIHGDFGQEEFREKMERLAREPR